MANATEESLESRSPLVDCDVHQAWADEAAIVDRLPDRYRENRGLTLPGVSWSNPHGLGRRDAVPEGGGRPGSDPDLLLEQHVDRFDVDYCVLNGGGILEVGVAPDAEYAAAVATAYAEWLVEEWLARDERFLGSLVVPPQAPTRAVEIVERFADHPQIVQVLLSDANANRKPYGSRDFWPIYRAAAANDLPVAIHPGTVGRGVSDPPTGAGYPAKYIEWHTVLPATYIGHVTSLVTEGVFVEIPDLTFVCVEGGLAWIPHLMWRLDKNWRALRVQTPWLERPPSEYVTDHVRFTTQPIEEPANPDHLRAIFEMIDADRTVMFSSDYPHWDNDSPTAGLPPLEDATLRNVRYRTAAETYDLPGDLPGASG